jgi:hypothetical protein
MHLAAPCSPASTLILAAVASAGLLVAFDHEPDHRDSSERRCRLAQDWSAGDVYHWQQLELRRPGDGSWREGDRKGTEREIAFRWRAYRSTLLIQVGGHRHETRYMLEPGGDPDTCVLRFDSAPLPDAFHEFYGAR